MTKREILASMERNHDGSWLLFAPGRNTPAFLKAYGYTKREAAAIFYCQLNAK